MKPFFHADNMIFRGISKWMDYVYVSFLWLVFSLPLITAGAAAAALYYTSNHCLRCDKGYIFRTFWKSFKDSFRQSAVVSVILVVLLGAIHLDMKLASGKETMKVFQIVFIAARFLILMVCVYVYPYIAKYEMKLIQVIKNCVYLSILNVPWTLLLVFILLAAICLTHMVPWAVLIMPSCVGVFFSLILEQVFSRYADERRERES